MHLNGEGIVLLLLHCEVNCSNAIIEKFSKDCWISIGHPYHHQVNRNDIVCTPSNPIVERVVTKISIVIRYKSKILKDWLILGSECAYQIKNSI